jgi:hypothetical protein
MWCVNASLLTQNPTPLVILSAVPTKFVVYTLAVETAGYTYKVPLRALHLSGNNFVGTVLSSGLRKEWQ